MKLEQAHKIGIRVVEALSPACDRVMLAGSIRREMSEVDNIVIVYIATMVERQKDLFSTALFPQTDELISDLVRQRFWQFDDHCHAL